MKPSKPLMIVDGYNVIHQTSRYSALIEPASSNITDKYYRARPRLVSDVMGFAGSDYDVLIVFDGGGNPQSQGKPLSYHGVKIIFSPTHTQADQVIEERAFQAQAAGREVVVVTSDQTTQWTVFKHGVTRMSARMFVEEETAAAQECDQAISRQHQKFDLGSRLNPAVAAALRQMARGAHR